MKYDNALAMRKNSPYSASFTAAGVMYSETLVVVQMLLEDNSAATKKKLEEEVQYLKIQSVLSRRRVTCELMKRFNMMPQQYWKHFLELPEEEKHLALFYVILKTYRILFEFQVNLALPKFNSIDRVLSTNDVAMHINEIASRDEFVDSWTEKTRKKVISTYLTMLRQTGLIDKTTGELISPTVSDDNFVPYIVSGDTWFLQACFIPQYRIENIKKLVK